MNEKELRRYVYESRISGISDKVIAKKLGMSVEALITKLNSKAEVSKKVIVKTSESSDEASFSGYELKMGGENDVTIPDPDEDETNNILSEVDHE